MPTRPAVLVLLTMLGAGVAAALDGLQWQPVPPPGAPGLAGVASDGEVGVAVGAAGAIVSWSAANGWRALASPTASDLATVAFGHGSWVAVGEDGLIVVSDDGVSWQVVARPTGHDLDRVVATDDGFVALSSDYPSGATAGPRLLESADGRQWAPVDAPERRLHDIAAAGDDRVLVGARGGWRLRPQRRSPATPGDPDWSVVTDAAHAGGLAGTAWRSDLVVHNPGPETVELELQALGSLGPEPASASPQMLVRTGRHA